MCTVAIILLARCTDVGFRPSEQKKNKNKVAESIVSYLDIYYLL